MTDLISRADAIDAVAQEWLSEASAESPYINDDDIGEYRKLAEKLFEDIPSADAEPKRVLQGYCKGANTIKTIRHEELTQIANTRKAVESADAVHGDECDHCVYKWGTKGGDDE